MTYTVQYIQFGVTETNDHTSENAAREAFAAVIADTDTTEAWIFDGPDQNAKSLDKFTRSEG